MEEAVIEVLIWTVAALYVASVAWRIFKRASQ